MGDEILNNCTTEEERLRTAELIRPILRGRDIYKYGYNWDNLWLINTHNGIKERLERIHIEDYPSIKQHLDFYINENECPHVTKLAKFKQPNCPTGMFWNTLCRI